MEIYIDDVKIGTVNDRETQHYEVKNGKHHVYVKLGWDHSQKIELNSVENEITVLKLTQYKYGALILIIGLALQALFIIVKDTLNFELKHALILLAIVISHPAYYMIKNKS